MDGWKHSLRVWRWLNWSSHFHKWDSLQLWALIGHSLQDIYWTICTNFLSVWKKCILIFFLKCSIAAQNLKTVDYLIFWKYAAATICLSTPELYKQFIPLLNFVLSVSATRWILNLGLHNWRRNVSIAVGIFYVAS